MSRRALQVIRALSLLCALGIAAGIATAIYRHTWDGGLAFAAATCVALSWLMALVFAATDVAMDTQARGNPVQPGSRVPPD